MLQNLGRRALDLLVGVFALLGFFYVPLGRHTGFEHLKAVVTTAPATEAYREIVAAAGRLHRTLVDKLAGQRPAKGGPLDSRAPIDGRRAPAMLSVASADAGCQSPPGEP